MLEKGSVIEGKYKILDEIGHGGMSTVYLALNEKVNQSWAIKSISKEGTVNETVMTSSLAAELKILRQLNHPNLVRLIDIFDYGNSIILVEDYIQGNTLQARLDEYGAQSEDDVCKWASQICDAFQYLHTLSTPIIYRDMKPSNVMLRPNGDICIIDFGTAREFKNDKSKIEDTQCLGTIGYAAPEQFGGHGETDARTDVYNLGATMYHLVTGHYPIEPPANEMRPIREINPALSEGLEEIILKCCHKNKDERYQSCADLKAAVQTRHTKGETARKIRKGKLTKFSVTAAVGVSLILGGFFANYRAEKLDIARYDEFVEKALETDLIGTDLQGFATASDYRVAMARAALQMDGSRIDAYEAMIEAFFDNEVAGKTSFTDAQYQIFIQYWKENEEDLLALNPQQYAEICYRMGNLCWFYYSNEDGTEISESLRIEKGGPWFEKASVNATSSTDNINIQRASAFADISNFVKNISRRDTEGTASSLYLELWDDIEELLLNIEEEDNTVRLQIYRLSANFIETYINNIQFYAVQSGKDDINIETVSSILDDIYLNVRNIQVISSDEELKTEILSREKTVRSVVENAFDE